MIYLFNNKKELNKIIPRDNLISATQDIELNGLYTSEVELPLFYKNEKGQVYNHKKSFDNAAFYGHFDRRKKFQMYKIYTRKVDNKNLVVSGIHLFFDEAKAINIVREKLLTDVDARTAINSVFAGTGWVVKDYDTTPLKSIDFIYTTPLEARKTIIETWNVELDFDFSFNGRKITAKNITLRKKLGKWTGDRYKYGTNILRIEQEQDESEVYTAAIGRGAGSGLEDSVMFTDLSWSKDGIAKPVGQDYIDIPSATAQYGYYDINGNLKPRIAIVEFDEPDRYVLANLTYDWLKQNCVPKISYSTTVAKIGDYYLGDEIGIIYSEIDIVKKARVEKMTINLLNWNKTEIGLGDYSYFKQDKAKQNMKAEIKKVRKESIDGITKAKLEFDNTFESQKQEFENQINQVNINATAQVQAAETRMNEQLSSAKSDLSGQISNSYSSAVQAAELKAKELDAVVTNQINSTKTTLSNDITSAYNKAVTDAETKAKALDTIITQTVAANKQAADKTMGELNTALGSTNNKVGTIEQNVTATQQNISTLTNTTNAQQTAINQAKQDISGLTTAVGGHTASISNLDNQIKLTATKTEVQNAIDSVEIGGRNLLLDSKNIRFTRRSGAINSVVDYLGRKNVVKIINGQVSTSTNPPEKLSIGNLTKGEQYTLSFDISVEGNIPSTFSAYLSSASGGYRSLIGTIEPNKFNRVYTTFTASADVTTRIHLNLDGFETVYLTDFKLELGNKPTDYTLAPEDIEAKITKNEASIQVNSDEITKRVTKTEFNTKTGQIEQTANYAKSTADSNSQTITTVKGNVDSLTQWRTDKGTSIDQTIDAVSTKVWNNEIDKLSFENRNLIPNSNFSKELDGWTIMYNSDIKYTSLNAYMISNDSDKYAGVRTPKFNIVAGQIYTLTIEGARSSNMQQLDYIHLMYDISGVANQKLEVNSFNNTAAQFTRISVTFTATHDKNGADILIAKRPITTTPDYKFGFYIRNVKLEKGSKATPYSIAPEDAENRITEIKQTADGALTKATTIGNDYVKQSAVVVQSDGVLIGSKKVSGAEMASAISVTPSNVDIITKVMRITADMQVAGDIKSLSLSAVYADIANLRANVITADSVTSTALKVDSALINKLNTNALLTNYLAADTAMINTIKSNAVTAVRADIAYLKANIITADSVTSSALKVDTALINKLNTNSILTNNLIADTVLTNHIKANAVTAVRGDIAYLKSNIITTNSISADALQSGTAMIDKLFSDSANISRLTSKTAFIKEIQAIEVVAYRLEARDKQASVNIENGYITMNRSDGSKMDLSLGGIQSFNSGGSLRFSLTPTLVTSSALGTSVSNVYLGTAPNAEARVVNMNGIPGDGAIGSYAYRPIRTLAIKFPLKANGYIGIDGKELRIMSDGLNEGSFRDVRADKGYFATVDANNELNGTHFYIRPKPGGELRATYNNGGGTSYANFRSNGIYAPFIDYNGHINGGHLYLRPSSGNEVRFTMTGTTDNWANIRFGSWNAMSHEKYKHDIEKWNYNVLDIYKNELELYRYKVNHENDKLIHHGIILRENSSNDKFPCEWRSGDGYDGTEVLWWNTKAIQELAFENDELRSDVSNLKNKFKELEEKINE